MEEPKGSKKEPPSGARNKGCRILVIIFGILLGLGIIAWFSWAIWYNYYKVDSSNKQSTANKATTKETTNTNGTWKLTMTDQISDTGPETSLTGNGSAETAIFQISGGKFTASGDYESQVSGVVGASADNGTTKGRIDISGQINGSRLSFTSTIIPLECHATVQLPMGAITNDQCDPNQYPDPHEITIDLKDGATATNNWQQTKNGYTLSWTEYWKLTKVQ